MKFKKIKLRTKIVLSIFIITSFGGIVSYLYFSEQFKEIKINGLVDKSRTIILSAETAREFSTDQFNHNIFKDSLKTVEEVLYTVPIFSAMEVAKKKADELGFTLKIPKNSPRNPDNHPDKFEKRVLKILGDKEVEEYWKIDEKTNSLRFFRPVVLTEDCMRCHGDPAKSFEYWGRTDGKDITGTKMEGWNVGEVHGAFEIFVDMKPIMAELNEKLAFISYFFAFLVIFLTGIGYLLSRMVNKEITTMNNLIKSLSNDISNGILENKIDQNKVGVDFKDVTLDINNLVDTFVKPFKLTSDLINRISKGRKVNLIEENYKGEFGNLKDSINNLIIVNDEITNSFRVISSGDLTKRLKVRSSEDELSISTNEIIDSISYTLGNIVNKFKRISSDIDLMSSNSDSLSSSIQEKSFQTDEIAAAMEEMSHTINQNAQSAETTSDMANINKGVASEGVEIVNESISKMKEISDVVENTANIITNLGNKSTEISKIISVIDDIADQTNMLALNAAIEAARAGEQGRGFAVVADEVRKLAERTSNATKDIETMIKEIQLVTKNAVSSMENGINEVNNGITLSNSAGRSLNKIFESSDNLLDMITSIVSATQEQASTSEEIARNVSDISIVISNSAKQIADNAELAERIRDFIYELEKEISKFKFDENIQNSNKSNEELGNKIESLNNRYLN